MGGNTDQAPQAAYLYNADRHGYAIENKYQPITKNRQRFTRDLAVNNTYLRQNKSKCEGI